MSDDDDDEFVMISMLVFVLSCLVELKESLLETIVPATNELFRLMATCDESVVRAAIKDLVITTYGLIVYKT